MWRHIDGFRRAAEELGVKVFGPIKIDIPAKGSVEVDMHFPDFGTKNGTLVVEGYGKIKAVKNDLLEAGYGCSVFDRPYPNTELTAEALAELLSDWGWNGRPEDQPGWVRPRAAP
jgi:hypothetical protein